MSHMNRSVLLTQLTESRPVRTPRQYYDKKSKAMNKPDIPEPGSHYVAVKISPKSKLRLLNHVKPAHPNVNSDHVTLISHPTEEELAKMHKHVGKQISFHATHHANDDREKIQAVRVRGLDHLSTKPHKHVTISTGHGVSAAKSNDLLDRHTGDRLSNWIRLHGTIEIVKREGRA